jgi:DNA-binding Lrp family transcriptional regulator
MREVELRLIAELMKNSRRSDRDLAKTLGVSQPTVSRAIKRLEKEGYIREYTAIPDFHRLGFDLMSVNFVKFKANTTSEDMEMMRKTANELEKRNDIPSLLIMNGMGLGSDRIVVMFHRDYSSYSRLVSIMKDRARGNVAKFDSFLVSLNDKTHYQPLTLAVLAGFLSRSTKADEEKP